MDAGRDIIHPVVCTMSSNFKYLTLCKYSEWIFDKNKVNNG